MVLTEFMWSIFSIIGLYKTYTMVRTKPAEADVARPADVDLT